MSEGTQKWIGRNRPPRVQITYDLETRGAIEKTELPLVVGTKTLGGDLLKIAQTPRALPAGPAISAADASAEAKKKSDDAAIAAAAAASAATTAADAKKKADDAAAAAAAAVGPAATEAN